MNRRTLAKWAFSLDAVLGILGIGGAALYGAALSPGPVWTTFLATFLPLSALWSFFCYLAYRGLGSGNLALKVVFWAYVVGNVFAFPVGTAIAGVSVWLWRESRSPGPYSDAPAARNRETP